MIPLIVGLGALAVAVAIIVAHQKRAVGPEQASRALESLDGGWSGSNGDEDDLMQLALALEQRGPEVLGTAILTDANGAKLDFVVEGTTDKTEFSLRLCRNGMIMELHGASIAPNRLGATVVHHPPIATPIMFFLTRDPVKLAGY